MWACRMAGVRFGGIQLGYGIRPDMFLFQPQDGPCQGTTLALPLDQPVPLRILDRVLDAEIAWVLGRLAA